MGDRPRGFTSANRHMGNALPELRRRQLRRVEHPAQKDGATRFLKNCGITFPAGDGALCETGAYALNPQGSLFVLSWQADRSPNPFGFPKIIRAMVRRSVAL